jgi:DNA-binding CsgD family transcriptional regulator
MSEKRTLSAGPQGPGLGRNSGTDRGGVDVNFASILSLDVSGGWYVLRVSGDGAVTGDASAMKVLRQFFAGHHGWEGSLPAPLAREFFDSRDWGLSNSPSRNWRSVTTVQAGMKLVANYVPDRDGGYVVLKSGPVAASIDASALPLSGREREIVTLVAAGKTNSEIGQLLQISARTVQKHLENIFRKLGVETRTALVMRATV